VCNVIERSFSNYLIVGRSIITDMIDVQSRSGTLRPSSAGVI
jgi:hypothetical protein